MLENRWPNLKIAALIPCLNEEAAISDVINDVRKYLPEAKIYVQVSSHLQPSLRVQQKCIPSTAPNAIPLRIRSSSSPSE